MIERIILLFQLTNFLLMIMGVYSLVKIRAVNAKVDKLLRLSNKKKEQVAVKNYLDWSKYELTFWKMMIPLGFAALATTAIAYLFKIFIVMTILGGGYFIFLVVLIVFRSRNNVKYINRKV